MSSTIVAQVAKDFFSEISQLVSIASRSGTITINGVQTQLIAVTISRTYDTSKAPPITSWLFGGVFEITQANSTVTNIRFEGRDDRGNLAVALEVQTLPDNPIVIANTGVYAILAVATIQPQTTVNIVT